ncbi:DNA alkylation repair protein [Aureisphaera galaxeae]|uniref:DNA alkylation repair protein n=1 Tax=Aureisphaera galaxeae TaxID=1538023 RepID=UPI0023508DCD|nr:DNA alkylation repair protein [Aureisphaera galaxeae]MDC8005248.1 DNA alkylation repair protein [Aureisphaera galaxeae]
MIPEHILNRKGARSFNDLDPEVIEYLNAGAIETKNLTEWLKVDQLILLKIVLDETGQKDAFEVCSEAVHQQKKPSANTNTRVIGLTLGSLVQDRAFYEQLRSHTSDVVRCWACWAESLHHEALDPLLDAMKPYAADAHFGVREVVIFATKERMIEDLDPSIAILTPWTASTDENIRRFAAEALRPVGVWVKKIAAFQEAPERGLPLLEPLKSDPSKYVRDSVGNWLNDASKSQPEWVVALCKRWEKESDTKETQYILRKALRTLKKKGS